MENILRGVWWGLRRFLQSREIVAGIVLLGFCLFMWMVNPIFFSGANLRGIALATSMTVPIVIGMVILLITGMFDLSVGSIAAASVVMLGITLRSTHNIPLSILVGLGGAVGFGVLNGVFISRIRVNALIVTIATMGIARAIALGMVKGSVVIGYPPAYSFVGQKVIGGVPVVVWISLVLIIVSDFLLRNLKVCRCFFYVGSNEEAALYSGINTSRIKFVVFVISGIASFVSGFFLSSRTMCSSPLFYEGVNLEAIAACIIGGASLTGGKGSVAGAILGLLIIIVARNILVILNISVYWKELAIGCILLTAISIDVLKAKLRKSFLRLLKR